MSNEVNCLYQADMVHLTTNNSFNIKYLNSDGYRKYIEIILNDKSDMRIVIQAITLTEKLNAYIRWDQLTVFVNVYSNTCPLQYVPARWWPEIPPGNIASIYYPHSQIVSVVSRVSPNFQKILCLVGWLGSGVRVNASFQIFSRGGG